MKHVVQNIKLHYLLHVIDSVKHKVHSIFLLGIALSDENLSILGSTNKCYVRLNSDFQIQTAFL